MTSLIPVTLQLSEEAADAAAALAKRHGLFSEAMAISMALHLLAFIENTARDGGRIVLADPDGTWRALPSRRNGISARIVTVKAALNTFDLAKADKIISAPETGLDNVIEHALMTCFLISRDIADTRATLTLIDRDGGVHAVMDPNLGFGYRPTAH